MEGMQVVFYDESCGRPLTFVVIVARYKEKWVLCRHKKRETLEVPGGHIEEGESADEAARRELYEETGAGKSDISFVCIYEVKRDGKDGTCGALYFAQIKELSQLPESEIGEVVLLDEFPEDLSRLTYPGIQPHLMVRVREFADRR